MLRSRVFLGWFVLLVLAWGIAGCKPSAGRSDQEDEKNPYFQKGKRMYQNRDYKGAVRYFQQALVTDPNNAAAHLELGLLYEDKVQDYAYAIYHYRRYLELRPTAEKAELVKQFVDRCKLALAASLPNTPLESGEEIARLRQENATLLSQLESLMATNRVLELRLARLQASPEERIVSEVVTQYIRVATPLPGAPAGAASPAGVVPSTTTTSTIAPVRADTSRPRTYVVQRGDSLYSIARKMYGREDKWRLIYEANRTSIPPTYQLKVGQTLTIPAN